MVSQTEEQRLRHKLTISISTSSGKVKKVEPGFFLSDVQHMKKSHWPQAEIVHPKGLCSLHLWTQSKLDDVLSKLCTWLFLSRSLDLGDMQQSYAISAIP